jgi:hypothetical protein
VGFCSGPEPSPYPYPHGLQLDRLDRILFLVLTMLTTYRTFEILRRALRVSLQSLQVSKTVCHMRFDYNHRTQSRSSIIVSVLP